MLCRIQSAAEFQIKAHPIAVEVDISGGEKIEVTPVGLPDTAVRESGQRVRSALPKSGYPQPQKKITIDVDLQDVNGQFQARRRSLRRRTVARGGNRSPALPSAGPRVSVRVALSRQWKQPISLLPNPTDRGMQRVRPRRIDVAPGCGVNAG